MKKLRVWKIFVPAFYNDGTEVNIEHHKKWDDFVEKLTKGLTIQKSSKGIWVNPDNKKYEEKMIPVEIACNKKKIKKISDFTAMHYKQQAVMYFPISRRVNIVGYDKKFNRIK